MKISNVEIRNTAVDIEYVSMSDLACHTCGRPEKILVTIRRPYFSLREFMCEARSPIIIEAALMELREGA